MSTIPGNFPQTSPPQEQPFTLDQMAPQPPKQRGNRGVLLAVVAGLLVLAVAGAGAQAGGSTADGWARARKLFSDSRYPDLRDSGTKLVDLMAQYDGLSSGGNETGAVLFMGSQIITAYGSLSGACSAHGVNLPALGSY